MSSFTHGSQGAFHGGVFSSTLANGRAGASIHVDESGVLAVASSGEEFHMPFLGMHLEMGGASGRMVFCRHETMPGLCIFSEQKGFDVALEAHSAGVLEGQIQAIRHKNSKDRRLLFAGLGAGAAVIWLAWWLFSSALTGLASYIPYSVDETIGEMASKQMDSGGPTVQKKVVVDAIELIVDTLKPYSRLREAEFNIKVVRSDVVNAYALPGGYMVVFTGLIEKADTYEEVAGVIGHEMAHVTLRHGVRRILRSVGVVTFVQLLLGDIAGMADLVVELFTLASINSYSREQESAADEEGVRMLFAAGINPAGAAEFFRKLKEEAGPLQDSGVLDWVSTHPEHQQRIDDINALVPKLGRFREKKLDIDWAAVKRSLKEVDSATSPAEGEQDSTKSKNAGDMPAPQKEKSE